MVIYDMEQEFLLCILNYIWFLLIILYFYHLIIRNNILLGLTIVNNDVGYYNITFVRVISMWDLIGG